MGDPVSSIRNLGPVMQEACSRAGILSAQQVRALGSDAAYKRLLPHGMQPHFIGYYALVMGLQGRPWNDCKGDEKKALRARFDVIKAGTFDENLGEFEKIMNQIGILEIPDSS